MSSGERDSLNLGLPYVLCYFMSVCCNISATAEQIIIKSSHQRLKILQMSEQMSQAPHTRQQDCPANWLLNQAMKISQVCNYSLRKLRRQSSKPNIQCNDPGCVVC